MNIRDFVGPFLLTTALFFLFRGWWGPVEQMGSDFIAPASQTELEPLYTTVEFDKEYVKSASQAQHATVATSYGEFIFSSHGASLEKAVLYQGKDKRAFTVIDQSLSDAPGYAPFLVALDKNTPWDYKLEFTQENDNEHVVVFTVKTAEASLRKVYTIDKNRHKMDLELTIIPNRNASTRARVLWPTPLLNDGQESIASQQVFRIDSVGSFKKYPLKKLNEQMGFFAPSFFGVESKYFVASYFQDHNQPAARAYYKVIDTILYGFIESKTITQETTLHYSFAMMPKDVAALYPDIATLEQTFDYGFFGFFTKFMLACLRFINGLVHNYGWSIIIITFILKFLLLPLTYNSAEKMKQIKESERRFNYMQQKLQHDPVALAELRENHVKENLSSILSTQGPLFIQMPFIFGLSGVINNSLELCGAPFMGWIQDLSLPDKYYILPILFGMLLLFNFVNTKGMNFKKFVGFLALTLFLVGWFTHFSTAFLLFLLVNMMFHVAQTLFVERVRG